MTEINHPSHNADSGAAGVAAATSAHPRPTLSLRNQTLTLLRGVTASPTSWRREHWILGGFAIAFTVLIGVIMPTFASAKRGEFGSVPLTTLNLDLPPPPTSAADDAALAGLDADTGANWKLVQVKPGQTLSDIFSAQGLGSSILHKIVEAQADPRALRQIHPGDEFAFDIDASGELRAFRFDRDESARVVVRIDNGKVSETVLDRAVDRRVAVAHGTITSSLFEAGDAAGMSDMMTLKLAKAFGYDIDFARDLREGDSFSVIYDQVYRDGELLRSGDVLAATFVNQGKRFTAIRYTNAKGETLYYAEDGRPLRRAFLRTPVEFTRISSRFSSGRKHPILGKMRAHRGVDYAAPSGTPIHSAGDGKVIFRGVQRGYGNVVIVQHQGKYTTLYGHMSRFASIRVGDRVRQGQVIGYVGQTGLATGPHLHYEFRLQGKHRDPLTVTLPKEEPLPPSELAVFKREALPMLARLKFVEDVRLARRD